MKRVTPWLILCLFSLSCEKQGEVRCYKAKLLLRGICGNAVVQILDTTLDRNLYEASWKHAFTGVVYENVAGSLDPCTFPGDLKEGQEFSFTIGPSDQTSGCAVCMAYNPTPTKKLNLIVCSED